MTILTIPFTKDELSFLEDEDFNSGKSKIDIIRDIVRNYNKERQEAKIIAGIKEAEREYEQGFAVTGDIEEILARM